MLAEIPPEYESQLEGTVRSEWFNKHLTSLSPLSPHAVTEQPPNPGWLCSLPQLHELLSTTDINYHTWASNKPLFAGQKWQIQVVSCSLQHPVATSTPPGNCNTEQENLASHRTALTPNGQRSSYWELAYKDNKHINPVVIYAFSESVQGCLSRFLEEGG